VKKLRRHNIFIQKVKTKYNYNRTILEQYRNYTAASLDKLWIFNYFRLTESKAQIFFVPVTKCRYPNQIARVRVFPDIQWGINFNYNIETPLYYKASTPLVEHYSGFNEGKINTSNNNKRKEILDKKVSNGLQHYVGRKTTFGLYVECEVSGEDDVFKLGNEFGEKYREMCAPLFFLVESLDNTLGISDAEEENRRLIDTPSTKKGLLGRLSVLPMSFELNPPSLGLGFGIGYSTT